MGQSADDPPVPATQMTEGTVRRHDRVVALLALAAIAILVAWTRFRMSSGAGVCLGNATATFHFAQRVSHGLRPYRDFVYPLGPLPLYADALAQRLFGPAFTSSICAGILATTVRAFIVWLLAKRLVDTWAAFALVAAFATSPVFGSPGDSPALYTNLFVLLAGLAYLRRGSARHDWLWLFGSGFAVSIEMLSDPGASVIAVVLLVGSASIIAGRNAGLTRHELTPLVVGAVGGIALGLALFAVSGILSPALGQGIFASDPSLTGPSIIADALFGGTLTDASLPSEFALTYLLLPAIVVALCVYFASRPEGSRITVGTVAMLIVPFGVIVSLASRYQIIEYFEDLPRTFLTVLIALTLAAPSRVRDWFGLDPFAVVVLGAVPLAADWAAGIRVRGRDGGDSSALVAGTVLLACASARLSRDAKRRLCVVLAVAAIAHFVADQRSSSVPYGRPQDVDGSRASNRTASSNALLSGVSVTTPRAQMLDRLAQYVHAGTSCFVYGDLPTLYTLLGCANPTRLDSLSPMYATREAAARAALDLKRDPPDLIIVQDDMPSLATAGAPADPSPAWVVQQSLHQMLEEYASVSIVDITAGAPPSCDRFTSVQLWQRRCISGGTCSD